MANESEIATKTDFAKLSGVSAARVSQWVKEGKIHGEALVGKGRTARIRVAIAREQLKSTLNPSQRASLNGLRTKLNGSEELPVPPSEPSIDDRIKAETLANKQLQNRRLIEEQRERAGIYMRTADAEREMKRIVGQVLKIFEGGLAKLSNGLSAKFGLPQRDVLHTLQSQFREIRADATNTLRKTLADMPEYLEDDEDRRDSDGPSVAS